MQNPFFTYNEILNKYIRRECLNLLYDKWHVSWRKFHNVEHLNQVLTFIEKNINKIPSHNDYVCLILAAFYHDAFYERSRNDNEEKSFQLFEFSINGNVDFKMKRIIKELIMVTKNRVIPHNNLERLFWMADNEILYSGFESLKQYEKKIREENTRRK